MCVCLFVCVCVFVCGVIQGIPLNHFEAGCLRCDVFELLSLLDQLVEGIVIMGNCPVVVATHQWLGKERLKWRISSRLETLGRPRHLGR